MHIVFYFPMFIQYDVLGHIEQQQHLYQVYKAACHISSFFVFDPNPFIPIIHFICRALFIYRQTLNALTRFKVI